MQFFAHVLVLSDIIELNRKTELFFQGRIKSVVMKMKIPVNGVLEWVLCFMFDVYIFKYFAKSQILFDCSLMS